MGARKTRTRGVGDWDRGLGEMRGCRCLLGGGLGKDGLRDQ